MSIKLITRNCDIISIYTCVACVMYGGTFNVTLNDRAHLYRRFKRRVRIRKTLRGIVLVRLFFSCQASPAQPVEITSGQFSARCNDNLNDNFIPGIIARS